MSIRHLLVFSAACCSFAQNTPGIDPRPGPADYPGRGANRSVSLDATLVTGSDQRKTLQKDWSGSYIVVEVALYPEAGHPLTVAPRDFMLRTESETVAPVDAEAILPYPNGHTGPVGPDSKVHVSTVDTIGVASGPNGRKVVYTDSQVQVAVGEPPVRNVPVQVADPKLELRRALEDKELPDIKTANPVAGYLYFPKPKHLPKDARYDLNYYGPDGQVKVALMRKP